MTHMAYRLTCDNCNKIDCDGFDDEKALLDHAESIGWKFIKVPNGSIWDYCPDCARQHLTENART